MYNLKTFKIYILNLSDTAKNEKKNIGLSGPAQLHLYLNF